MAGASGSKNDAFFSEVKEGIAWVEECERAESDYSAVVSKAIIDHAKGLELMYSVKLSDLRVHNESGTITVTLAMPMLDEKREIVKSQRGNERERADDGDA